ncbi:hypothetical protein [Lichenihabitans psoromatis]|uniref:hypothetical protein n=1 Tax=Lichenihabitans psoromatis TaxID=2528642 RepID=UPI0010361B76|nr:hypothetical protein [Lichenihabitans psoromatis]
MTVSGAAGRIARIGFCTIIPIVLSGCGGTSGFEPKTSDNGTMLGNLIAFNNLNVGPAKPAAIEEKLECPNVEVLDGTASLRTYAGADQSNASVKYQYSLGDVVRECSHVGSNLVLKVGLEGRVLIGPAGTAGSFTAPIRIAIRNEKTQQVILSKFYRIPVTVPGGQSQGDFSLVSDPIAVQFVSAQAQEDYTVVVGFDEKGAGAAPIAKKSRRHMR